jgi:hypothetical protein
MMSNARRRSLAPCAAALGLALAALALAACTSVIDAIPEKIGGLPAEAPKRVTEPLPDANVYEVRPTREVVPLDLAEQKKLESELTALREGQKQRANPPPEAPPPPPPPPPVAAKKAAAKAPPEAKKPAEAK